MAKKIPQINASSMADISFLLLIFFLVTTSMDVNQGLARRLPAPVPPDQKVEDTEINKRNLMVVKINSLNQLMVQGQLMEVRQLREEAKKFILNANDDAFYPKLYEEDFGAPFGVVRYTRDHVISVQNDVDTRYQSYLDVQNELVAAYNELRNELAKQKFGREFQYLTEEEKGAVKKYYPQNISEAEPKKYGGDQ